MTIVTTFLLRRARIGATAFALAAVLSAGLSADPAAAADGLRLSDAWVRTIVPSRPAAGYFTLHNDGDHDMALVGAQSPSCKMTMLHQSTTVDGVDKMMPVKRVVVPAKGTLAFKPHGYHVMCMGPAKTVTPGSEMPITLEFADGSTLAGKFKVYGAKGKQ